MREQVQDGMLDRVFGYEIDHCHGLQLPLAPDAGNALLEPCRVPGQIEIDDAARHLKIEAGGAGVRRQEQPARRILPEAGNLGAAAQLRHVAGVPGAIEAHLRRQFPHQLQHPHPFGKHDNLALAVFEQLFQHAFQLFELGAYPAVGVENGRRIADHAHAGEILLKLLELLLGQRAALGDGGEPAGQILVVGVARGLLMRHRDKEALDRAAGQFLLHVALAPAQHDAAKAAVHLSRLR